MCYFPKVYVYFYEKTNRELKRKLIYLCRCNEIQKVTSEGLSPILFFRDPPSSSGGWLLIFLFSTCSDPSPGVHKMSSSSTFRILICTVSSVDIFGSWIFFGHPSGRLMVQSSSVRMGTVTVRYVTEDGWGFDPFVPIRKIWIHPMIFGMDFSYRFASMFPGWASGGECVGGVQVHNNFITAE